jgi:hypothetical protein
MTKKIKVVIVPETPKERGLSFVTKTAQAYGLSDEEVIEHFLKRISNKRVFSGLPDHRRE